MDVLGNIQNDINAFKADVLDLEKFLTGTRASYSFFQAKYPEVQREFNEKERNDVEIEGMSIFDNLNSSVAKHEMEVLKYCFINLIARTDAFLNDIARSIYLWKKPNLPEEVKDRAILKFSHASFKKKLEHLKNEFELTFPDVEEKESIITELFSTRNIILHNNSLINETYLKINQGSRLTIGSEKVVNESYLKLTFVIAVIIAKSIQEQVYQKYSQEQ